MYQVELIWNREFHFVPYGDWVASVEEAERVARAMEALGDGECVKKTRIIDMDGNVVRADGVASAVEKNPFKVGDRVALRPDVLKRHSRSVPAHLEYTREQFDWRDTLRALNGIIGTVSCVFDGKHVNVDFDAPGNASIGVKPYRGTIGIDYTELVYEADHNAVNDVVEEIINEIKAEEGMKA